MHIIEVLDDMNMGDPVKCLVEVNQDSKDSMGLLKIKRGVDEVQESGIRNQESGIIYVIDLTFNYTFKSFFTLMYNFTIRFHI